MTTLITGATGFLGGHLARELHEAGDQLRILVRPHSSREGLAGVPVEEVAGDVRDLESLRQAMKGIDRVVHAAGATRLDPFAPEKLRRVNVEGTRNVVTAAREAGVQRLLHVSSTAAVGSGSLDRPADETTPWNLEHKGPYWQTKHAGEELVLEAAKKGELDAVVVNPSYVLGPGDVKPTSGVVLTAVATGLVRFFPEGGCGFVDVRDVAHGARIALEKGRTGERYILSAENLTYRALIDLAAHDRHLQPSLLPLPKQLALGAGRLGDLLGKRFPKAFGLINSAFLGTLYELAYVSCVKARQELGFEPRPVREAVRDAYLWFEQTGRLKGAAMPMLSRLSRRASK